MKKKKNTWEERGKDVFLCRAVWMQTAQKTQSLLFFSVPKSPLCPPFYLVPTEAFRG